MARQLSIAAAGLSLAMASASPAQILEYTEATSSPTEIALGYPVPEPVASLTAVAGFREYDSLLAQHQDLALGNAEVTSNVVGTTVLGRDIFAYRIGDADALTIHGEPEPAVLINAGIHAREWASPEVATELFEQLVERKSDSGIVQYIVDNVNTVILPVNNVDGFIQTQRYPTEVTPTPASAPGVAQFDSPRDGRMRRKNMRDVDEDLASAADRLLGVDLNRNNAQFFDGGGNSTDPASLVYRGVLPASEPEILALQAAATLAPADRLRLFVDTHSFSRVLFVPSPPNARQRNNTRTLANKFSAATGTDPRYPAYFPIYDPVNSGASTTAAFFAYTYNVPAWTLEIEPPLGFQGIPDAGAFYGGFGVPQDGFILPASEIGRVRDELAVASLLLLYHQAGPPAAQAIEVRNAASEIVYAAAWQSNGDGTRTLTIDTDTGITADGSTYSVWLSFDKPMRFVDSSNAVADYPGQLAVGTQPIVRLENNGSAISGGLAGAEWLLDPGDAPNGYRRYRGDAVRGTLQIPNDSSIAPSSQLALSVLVTDMSGLGNDGDPSTVVDFAGGGWTGYEDGNGLSGDVGGADRSFLITVNPGPGSSGPPAPPAPAGGGGGGSGSGLLLAMLLLLAAGRRRGSRWRWQGA